ncbi:MAG TPA: trypco2 family protein [Candidatus Acidoferrales bacterium]|nr:trypco2 family protein [Candidatus Acidoferrales bacterium]
MELGLTDLIATLKEEIGKLQFTGRPMFFIEGVELELKFVVERTADAFGKVQWLLFAAEAKGTYKNEHVNTVTLSLKPMGRPSLAAG